MLNFPLVGVSLVKIVGKLEVREGGEGSEIYLKKLGGSRKKILLHMVGREISF